MKYLFYNTPLPAFPSFNALTIFPQNTEKYGVSCKETDKKKDCPIFAVQFLSSPCHMQEQTQQIMNKKRTKIIRTENNQKVLLRATCSSLVWRGANSHKECKSRMPHNKYLSRASSLSDDTSTEIRCKGRNPASFSTSI